MEPGEEQQVEQQVEGSFKGSFSKGSYSETLVGHVRRASTMVMNAITPPAYRRPVGEQGANSSAERADSRMSFYALFPVYKPKSSRQENLTSLSSTAETFERRPRKPKQDRSPSPILSQVRRFSTLASRARRAETGSNVDKESHDHGEHGARANHHKRQPDAHHGKNPVPLRAEPPGPSGAISGDNIPTPRVV